MDQLHIKKGSKDSQALFRFMDGHKEAGFETVPDAQTKNLKTVYKYEKYGYEDLVKDVGEERAKEIQEASQWLRKEFDEMYKEVADARKDIYPNIETDYKTKMDKYQEKINSDISRADNLKKEMDRLSEEIESIKKLPINQAIKEDMLAEKQGGYAQVSNLLRERDAKITETKNKMFDLKNEFESGKLTNNRRIPYRNNYIRHYSEYENGFHGLKRIMNDDFSISPEMVGISEYTKPNSKWSSITQRFKRGGKAYEEDAIGAYLDYVKHASRAAYVDPVIKEIRSLAKTIAEAKTNGSANHFINYLHRFANNLAGKTPNADRWLNEAGYNGMRR